jgi:LPS export ABC transporter protein LptC
VPLMFIGLRKKCPALLAFCLWGLVSLQTQPLVSAEPTVTPPTTITPEKQGEMEKIKLTEIQEGVKKWVLTADSADYLKDKDRIYLNKVRVEIFGKDSDKTVDDIIITGDSGFIGVKNRDLSLEGNVHARTATYEFTSNLLNYDPKTRILTAPGPVKVQGPRLYTEGIDMTVDLKINKLDLARHTVTKLQVPGKLWQR